MSEWAYGEARGGGVGRGAGSWTTSRRWRRRWVGLTTRRGTARREGAGRNVNVEPHLPHFHYDLAQVLHARGAEGNELAVHLAVVGEGCRLSGGLHLQDTRRARGDVPGHRRAAGRRALQRVGLLAVHETGPLQPDVRVVLRRGEPWTEGGVAPGALVLLAGVRLVLAERRLLPAVL